MNIEQISRIKAHQIFNDFSWPTDLPDFRKFNLIFAPNGSGKTTLSSLFRRLGEGLPLSPEEGEVRFRIDGRLVDASSIMGRGLPQIRVFNRDSIERVVLEGHRDELPPVFYLGEENVQAQKRIEILKKRTAKITAAQLDTGNKKETEIVALESFCTSSARAIKYLLTGDGSPYNTYDKSRFKSTMQRLSKLESPRSRVVAPIDRNILISRKSALPKAKIQAISNPCERLWELRQQVEGLLRKSVTAAIITSLTDNSEVANWVKQGLKLHSDAVSCLFCNGPIPPTRLKELEGHFNLEYQNFTRGVEALVGQIKARIVEARSLRFPSSAEFYEDEVYEFEKCRSFAEQMAASVAEYLEGLTRALEEKGRHPFTPLELIKVTGRLDPNSKMFTWVSLLSEAFQNTFGGTASSE